jgi:hypothetical protein
MHNMFSFDESLASFVIILMRYDSSALARVELLAG